MQIESQKALSYEVHNAIGLTVYQAVSKYIW